MTFEMVVRIASSEHRAKLDSDQVSPGFELLDDPHRGAAENGEPSVAYRRRQGATSVLQIADECRALSLRESRLYLKVICVAILGSLSLERRADLPSMRPSVRRN